MASIGETIKQYRLKKEMTQKELARLMQVSHSTIVQYEKGNVKNIPSGNLYKLSAFLNIPLKNILPGNEYQIYLQTQKEVNAYMENTIIINKSEFTPAQIEQIENFIAFVRTQGKDNK